MTSHLDVAATDSVDPDGVSVEARPLRILCICPYLPLPFFGAGRRVFNLLKVLAATSRIDLIAGSTAWQERHETMEQLRAFCHSVNAVPIVAPSEKHRRRLQLRSLVSSRPTQYWTHYSESMQDCIDQSLQDMLYDLVLVEHSFAGYYRFPGDIPRVLDQHNVESEILWRVSRRDPSSARRALNLLDFWKYRGDERQICRDMDLVLAVSDRDQHAMQSWGGVPNCLVIPNGVDIKEFSPPDNEDSREREANVIFTGPLHYGPNAEAMSYFGREVWPLVRQQAPNAELTIVGANPPREIQVLRRLHGITVTGFVPDVRPYLSNAQVVVAPLRIGGGTRLKILEALAMSRAVVSTSLACEGLDVRDGHDLLVADEPALFAQRVVELLADPVRRQVLGRNGRRLVEDRYDWKAIGGSLDEALRALIRNWNPAEPHVDVVGRAS